MNLTLAPAKSPLTCPEYISKPLTMSLPTWANGPVIGAMNPTISSCAAAPVVMVGLTANARHPPITINPVRPGDLLVMIPTPLRSLPIWTSPLAPMRRQRNVFPHRRSSASAPLANLNGNAHQAARQIKNDEDIDSTKRVLPPRDKRTQIFTQKDDDAGADGATDQRSRASKDDHQQGVDRGGQNQIFGTDVTVRMGPQNSREPAESAGNDESNVFVQPGIVAKNTHSDFSLANAFETSPERRLNQDIEHCQRRDKETEHHIKVGDVVGKSDAEFGPAGKIDAVVAAGHGIPPVGEPPHALPKGEGDHQEIHASRADREQSEDRRRRRPDRASQDDHQPETPSQPEAVFGSQDRRQVCSDAEIRRLSERREPGKAEQDVQAHGEDRENHRSSDQQDAKGIGVRCDKHDREQDADDHD